MSNYRDSKDSKDTEDSEDEKKVRKTNQLLQSKIIHNLMISEPEMLAQKIFSSDRVVELLILSITYLLKRRIVQSIKNDIVGIENLVAILNSFFVQEQYKILAPDSKLKFINRIRALSELKTVLEQTLKSFSK